MSIYSINSVEIYLLTIKSGGQEGQPDAEGTIIFQGKIFVDDTQNIIVGIYETNNPQTNLLLPMDDQVWPRADNIYPVIDDGVNFESETLLNGLGNSTTSSSFNLYYENDLVRLYQNNAAGYLSTAYYEITIELNIK